MQISRTCGISRKIISTKKIYDPGASIKAKEKNTKYMNLGHTMKNFRFSMQKLEYVKPGCSNAVSIQFAQGLLV